MKDRNYFSDSKYIHLPSYKKPKTSLAIDNKRVKKNSFKLYNPFSKKIKYFKSAVDLLLIIFKYTPFVTNETKSDFVRYLEEKLNKKIITSIYYPPEEEDKVVIQVQSCVDSKVLGYIKLSLTSHGYGKINNEKNAIDVFQKLKLVPENYFILDGLYKKMYYIFVSPIDGVFGYINYDGLVKIIKTMRRNKKFPLKSHPRILNLQCMLNEASEVELSKKLTALISHSCCEYSLVYEHGDMAPWNMFNVNGDYVLFDFEHFVEDGLEYMDIIKYYFQVEYLINKKTSFSVYEYLSGKLKIDELFEIYNIFLMIEYLKTNDKEYRRYVLEEK
jgi:hypothetical protein